MNKREVLEWMSLAPADIPCWLAGGCLVGMWYAGSLMLAIVLAVVAVLLALLACYYGMPAHADLGKTTNTAKLVAYPLNAVAVMLVAGAILMIRSYPT